MSVKDRANDRSMVRPDLQPAEVHVWQVDICPQDPDIYRALLPKDDSFAVRVLSEEELERAQRFVKEVLRIHFSASHVALRHILSQYVEHRARDIAIRTEVYGRPILDATKMSPCPNLHFNLTHSGDRAMVAVALEREVGIDLEQNRFMNSRSGIGRQVYTETEITRLEGATDQQWFSYWTAKEAVIKSVGMGFHLNPKNVQLDEAGRVAVSSQENMSWKHFLTRCDPDANWSACVATTWQVSQVVKHVLDWRDVLRGVA